MLNEIAKAAVMDPTPVLAVILVPSKRGCLRTKHNPEKRFLLRFGVCYLLQQPTCLLADALVRR